MITAVASTKYKTRSGMPVTLVGLHGKDELLVVGPASALIRLAAGEVPKPTTSQDLASEFERALQFVLEEIFWLQRVEILLAIAQPDPAGRAAFADPVTSELIFGELIKLQEKPVWKKMSESVVRYAPEPAWHKTVAEEMLQGMFRCALDECIANLRTVDVRQYSKEMISECLEKYKEFLDISERIYDVHPFWWSEWSPEDKVEQLVKLPNYLTTSGRNISKYHFANISEPDNQKTRQDSMHEKWNKLLQKYCSTIVSSEHLHSILGKETLLSNGQGDDE
jgi:hypothetical protein